MADKKTTRPWKTIAAELTKETDPERVIDLARELEHALSTELDKIGHKTEDHPAD